MGVSPMHLTAHGRDAHATNDAPKTHPHLRQRRRIRPPHPSAPRANPHHRNRPHPTRPPRRPRKKTNPHPDRAVRRIPHPPPAKTPQHQSQNPPPRRRHGRHRLRPKDRPPHHHPPPPRLDQPPRLPLT